MNIPATDVDIRRVLANGHTIIAAKRQEREETLRGLLRAGSSGCVADGKIYGECHRIAHLRWLGHDKPAPLDRKLMFEGGEGNEDLWRQVLEAGWSGTVSHGQEYRTDLPGAGTLHGTSDLVLSDGDGPRVLLELKLVSALNTAISRYCEGKPDSKHLIQSAVYMLLTGLPVVLCYTSRSDFAVQFKAKALGITKIPPFYRFFYLHFRDGRLYYRDEFEQGEVPTACTVDGIREYYRRLTAVSVEGLGVRPENGSITGEEGHWDRCDAKYCHLADVCDRYEGHYPTWLDAATQITKERT